MHAISANPSQISPAPSPQPPAIDATQAAATPANPNGAGDTAPPKESSYNDRLQISGAARALASQIASATEANETAVQEAVEGKPGQLAENEQVAARQVSDQSKQPPVNQATQKTITTRIDVVA